MSASTDASATTGRRQVDPRLLAVAGSLCIALSPILIALSGTSPGTATFFRCLLGLPVLVPMALLERRRLRPVDGLGGVPRGRPWLIVVGGLLLGFDMTLWTGAIHAVGAGVSTVLVNVQVVILPLLAFLVLRERVRPSFLLAVPVMLGGVALAGGLADGGGGAAHPVLGTVLALLAACAYAGYLLFLRIGSAPGQKSGPVALATAAAAVSSFVLGSFWEGVDLTPGWEALGWLALLALIGQCMGWVLIAGGMARLPSSTGASILLLQPVGAVLLGMLVLGQFPTTWQLAGCVVVIGAVAFAARTRAEPAPEEAVTS
ncbi:DMT family transporter [Actinomycetospora sp. TBRC 11914]|uniref:DMT family transporter n=1 Tax=Actinomycetospora sp. TBRC 11914 TaxID=2729387 RepID=UPI00145F7CF2|nr:DMT family transporter [Actinomycetospora sp. TBRC 11914]NMO89599.1 DMT family transporter [Actinomycetospora sp. TBRC 11914]